MMHQVVSAGSADHSGSQKNKILSFQPDSHNKLETSAETITPAKRVKISDSPVEIISTQEGMTTSTVDCDNENDQSKISSMATAVTPNLCFSSSVFLSANEQTHKVSRTPMTCEKAIETLLLKEAGYNISSAGTTVKRSDYISWDDYFMATAAISALRSKDPVHATGACIVDCSNRIIGIGYNGFPAGCSDDVLPWTNSKSSNDGGALCWLHTKSPFVVHAEVNAILNKCAPDCTGARLYTQHFPCNECAKIIAQSRISEVVYVHERHDSTADICNNYDASLRASRILLSMAGVRMRQYKPQHKQLVLDFWKALDIKECERARNQIATAEKVEENQSFRREAVLKHRDLLVKEANYDPLTAVSCRRKVYLSWDDYFMSMAFLTAQRSKDPNTQVGACIVDSNKRIVGLGYNGFPAGCSDDCLPWAREATSELHKKYVYVCHAEVNAILNKGSADVNGATLYVALFPCHDCSKIIIQAGIREVVYMSDRYHDTESCRASRILFQMAGVVLRKYIPKSSSLCIYLDKDGDNNND